MRVEVGRQAIIPFKSEMHMLVKPGIPQRFNLLLPPKGISFQLDPLHALHLFSKLLQGAIDLGRRTKGKQVVITSSLVMNPGRGECLYAF